jgi:L-amino acid N-acyltransferase YncA
MRIRDAVPQDAAACARVYEPYVRDTAVSFETEAPTAEQMAERIVAAQRAHAWLVAEDEGRVVGYAYAGPFRTREAYRFSCEVSVYLEPGRRRTGTGRALCEALLDRLTALGYRTALGGTTLPNPASEGLLRALGFEPVGVFRHVGWKNDAWHDVAWLQLDLGGDGRPG